MSDSTIGKLFSNVFSRTQGSQGASGGGGDPIAELYGKKSGGGMGNPFKQTGDQFTPSGNWFGSVQ